MRRIPKRRHWLDTERCQGFATWLSGTSWAFSRNHKEEEEMGWRSLTSLAVEPICEGSSNERDRSLSQVHWLRGLCGKRNSTDVRSVLKILPWFRQRHFFALAFLSRWCGKREGGELKEEKKKKEKKKESKREKGNSVEFMTQNVFITRKQQSKRDSGYK